MAAICRAVCLCAAAAAAPLLAAAASASASTSFLSTSPATSHPPDRKPFGRLRIRRRRRRRRSLLRPPRAPPTTARAMAAEGGPETAAAAAAAAVGEGPSAAEADAASAAAASASEAASAVEAASSKSGEWLNLPRCRKIALLRVVRDNAASSLDAWSESSLRSRGVSDPDVRPSHGSAASDALVGGPATLGSYLNVMLRALERAERGKGRRPPPPGSVRTVGRRRAVRVFPDGPLEFVEAAFMSGELVLSPGSRPERMTPEEADEGGVAAVLGAGNFDAPVDVLCQMFLKGRTCVYKPNPVNAGTSSVLRDIFSPLIEGGYLRFVDGGAEVGSALVRHPLVDEIVLTGSALTYEKIVWGSTDEERRTNREANSPLVTAPVCAELGSVNPWIVVPGPGWTEGSVDDHARHLAFAKLSNGGHVCASPQVVITSSDWEWRECFLDRLRAWMSEYAGGPPFYPGLGEVHSLYAGLPGAEVLEPRSGTSFEGQQRPVLIAGVKLGGPAAGPVLRREAFCPVLAEVPLDASPTDPMAFLDSAVRFADEEMFGSLTATVVVTDRTRRRNVREFDSLVAGMPFGVVGINVWPLFAHSMPQLTWGAYPGREESGTGIMGNALLYRDVEKAVLAAPFRWLGRRVAIVRDPRRQHGIYECLARYKLRPGVWSQARLFAKLFLNV